MPWPWIGFNMESCVSDVRSLMLIDNRKLNDDKTEFPIIGTAQQVEKFDIPFCQRWQLLHSSRAYRKESLFVVFYLYNIWRIRKFLSQKSAETLIHAFATSQLDNCKSLLYGLLDCSLNKLQREQNACARRTFNEHKFCHITRLLWSYTGYQPDLELSLKWF